MGAILTTIALCAAMFCFVGDSPFVAETDAIRRYPVKAGQTAIGGARTAVQDLPTGPINHHGTKTNRVDRRSGMS